MSDTIPAPPPMPHPRARMLFTALLALTSTDPTAYVVALANDCARFAIETKALPAVLDEGEDFESWAERACCPGDDDWQLLNALYQGRYGREPSDEESEAFETEWLIVAWDAGVVPTLSDVTQDELPLEDIARLLEAMGDLWLAMAVTSWGGLLGLDVGQVLVDATPAQLDALEAQLAQEGLVRLHSDSRTLCLTEAGQAAYASEGEVTS